MNDGNDGEVRLSRDKNFHNVIRKRFEYLERDSNSNRVQVVQEMAECGLCFEVPIYLLHLWKSYFRDTINSLNHLSKIIEDREHEQRLKQTLTVKLNDVESLFDYYLQTTENFAKQREKFKRSVEKTNEILKFIPINLHVEKMLVESDKNHHKSEYEFTSCGAFTTYHMDSAVSSEYFDPENEIFINNNLILLIFYTFKLLIQLTEDIKACNNLKNSDQNYKALVNCLPFAYNLVDLHGAFPFKFAQKFFSLKVKLQTICNDLLPSYTKYVKLKIPNAQNINAALGSTLEEQMEYIKIKLNSILIEVNHVLLGLSESSLELTLPRKFFHTTVCSIIEFMDMIITNLIDKFNFVDTCALLSQSLTTALSAIHLRFYNHLEAQNAYLFNFYQKNGLIIEFESLVSCTAGEAYMLSDHIKSINYLNSVYIHLPNLSELNSSESRNLLYNESLFQIDFEKDGLHICLYSHDHTSRSNAIKLYPILINVGINELAISSHLFGRNNLQNYTIKETLKRLKSYYEFAKANLNQNTKLEIEAALSQINNFVGSSNTKGFLESSRPSKLLHLTSDVSKALNGLRVTNCKSGKDRTGMSVSYEECCVLLKSHNLPESMFQTFLDNFRRSGTRIENCRKNVGKNKYSFNKLRLYLLPQIYRPPMETVAETET